MTEKLVIRLKREERRGGSNVKISARSKHSIVSDQDAGDAELTKGRLPGNISSGEIYAWNAFSRTLSRREFFF